MRIYTKVHPTTNTAQHSTRSESDYQNHGKQNIQAVDQGAEPTTSQRRKKLLGVAGVI